MHNFRKKASAFSHFGNNASAAWVALSSPVPCQLFSLPGSVDILFHFGESDFPPAIRVRNNLQLHFVRCKLFCFPAGT